MSHACVSGNALALFRVLKVFPWAGYSTDRFPYSSVGNSFRFSVVEDTGLNLSSSVIVLRALVRSSLTLRLPGYLFIATTQAG